jgi:hypothetical protein
MAEKESWREFAEVTGFYQSWKQIALGAAIGLGILLVAAVADKIGDWLQSVM